MKKHTNSSKSSIPNKSAQNYPIFGEEFIAQGAIDQMNTAMQLPISIAGSLMPDAHVGYGLPIGGVLAVDPQFIIPYAVGVDIACRMCLSIFDYPEFVLNNELKRFTEILDNQTVFGVGGRSESYFDTTLFDDKVWQETTLLRSLKDKAYQQLGTSGSGNHFVEFGVFTMKANDISEVPQGKYIALLSHSGSRGFGATIANHYSKLAMNQSQLPKQARHLAWLDLKTEEGQEYWLSMNLAGRYASANHHEIHNKIARALQQEPLFRVENHHNFAWKEKLNDGTEVMVHRKGATPAHKGELGFIPGTMSTEGFLVRGKGHQASLNSSAHGAGREMSRRKAKDQLKGLDLAKLMKNKGIQLIGAGLDEAPMAYKDIHSIMAAQTDLIEILGSFEPKIVKMADSKEKPED